MRRGVGGRERLVVLDETRDAEADRAGLAGHAALDRIRERRLVKASELTLHREQRVQDSLHAVAGQQMDVVQITLRHLSGRLSVRNGHAELREVHGRYLLVRDPELAEALSTRHVLPEAAD
jgi:hypothetical protein